MHPWNDWDHIVKIDPDKTLLDGETFEDVCATGTDAITVGGTTGMTEEKMSRVIEACGKYHLPVYIEPSHYGAVVHSNALDGYLIPVVFNASDVAWTTGVHKEWVRIDDDIDWAHTFPEAYIILNPDSSVAEVTQANCDLAANDVAAYAEVAEHMFGQPIVYVEYSGVLGDPKKVQAAHDALDTANLFYGGGVHDYDSAHRMAQNADTIVVGDIVHDEGVDAVRETVRGVKNANASQ